MSTFRAPVALVCVALVLGACSSDDDSASSPSTDGTPITTEAGAATPTDPPTTAAPTSTAAKETPESGTPATESTIIELTFPGEPLTASVMTGSPVLIRVVSAEQHEFHLHGYDIKLTGVEVNFDFMADQPGSFELEEHESGDLLLTLEVVDE